MPIIAIGGKARAGKDSFADILVNEHGFIKVSFADELRSFCSKVFKINKSEFLDGDKKDKEFESGPIIIDFHHIDKIREILITEYGYEVNYDMREALESIEGIELKTPRHVLRIVGNTCRDCVDDEIWIRQMLLKIKESSGKVVVADCRFDVEREIMRKIGAILVKVKRNDNGSTQEHEFDLGQDSEYDVIFDNSGTLNEYIANVKLWYCLRKAELEYTHPIKFGEL